MVEESNQNVFLIQIDASSFAELEISEFEVRESTVFVSHIYYFDHYQCNIFCSEDFQMLTFTFLNQFLCCQHYEVMFVQR